MSDLAHVQRQLGLALQQRQFAQAAGLADAIIAVAQGARPTTQHALAVKQFVKLRERLDVAASALFIEHLSALHLGKPTGDLTTAVRDFAATRPGTATVTESLLAEAPELRALVGDAFSVAVSEAAQTQGASAGKVAGGLGAGVGVLLVLRLLLKGAVIASRNSHPSSGYAYSASDDAYLKEMIAEAERNRVAQERAWLDSAPTPMLVGFHRLPAKVPLNPRWGTERERVALAEFSFTGEEPIFQPLQLGSDAEEFLGNEQLDRLYFDASGKEVLPSTVRANPKVAYRTLSVFSLPPDVVSAVLWWHPRRASAKVTVTPAKLTFLPPESLTAIGLAMIDDAPDDGLDTWALLVRARSVRQVPSCTELPFDLVDTYGVVRGLETKLIDTSGKPDFDFVCVFRTDTPPTGIETATQKLPLPPARPVKTLSAAVKKQLLEPEW